MEDFYTKIIVTIIPTNVVTSLLWSLFCPFEEIKNKNQIFSKLMVWLQEIVLLFVYRYAKGIPISINFYKKIFLHVISVPIIVLCTTRVILGYGGKII